MKTLSIKTINRESFGQYGVVLEHVNQEEGYEPLVIAESRGWIWAVLTFRLKSIARIECHPTSKESFEPVSGVAVLCLAPPEDPTAIEAFLLDKAVVLNKGVWHDVFALSEEALIKIAENLTVTGEFHELDAPLRATVVGA